MSEFFTACSVNFGGALVMFEIGNQVDETEHHWPIRFPPFCANAKRFEQLVSSLNRTYSLAMNSQTHFVQSAALISILQGFVAPLDDTILPGRVDKLEAWCKAFHAIIAYLGKPPYLNSMWFWWESTANTLAFVEAKMFPEQPVMTQTHVAASESKRPIHHLGLDAWKLNNKNLIRPAWEELVSFSDWLYSAYDPTLNADIFESLEDCLLLLESAGHACGLDVCACRPFEVAAGSGGSK